jgi:heme-degrading monooxygenase HmoA
MAHIIVWHQVEDFDLWKSKFDEHGPIRGAAGSQGGTVYRSSGGSNEVVIVLAWDSKENAQAFMASQDLQVVMADAGVTGQPMVAFLDDSLSTPV